MVNCIVVDDEPLARQLVESYIHQIPELHLVGSYKTALEAFMALHQHDIDILFLDIEMPGLTGLGFVKSLKKSPSIIFITAYTEFAVEAFEVEALDYLVKPVTFERFLKAVQKAGLTKEEITKTYPEDSPLPYIFLKVERRLIKVDLSEIIYVEGFGDYLKVHSTSQTHITYMTMSKLEALLPAAFIRIHRSAIVNVAYIQFIEGNFIKVKNLELPIGPTYREFLIERLRKG